MMPEDQPAPELSEAQPAPEPIGTHPSEPAAPAPRTPVWGWRDVLLFVGLSLPIIALIQFAFAGVAAIFHHSPYDPVVAVIAQGFAYPIVFALLAGILRTQYDVPFWPSIGWVRSNFSVVRSLTIGVLLALGLAVLGGLLHIPNVDSPVTKLLASRDSAIVLAFFGVLVAPIAEELAFRGFLQPLLIRSLGAAGGIAVTAFLFGMLHWQQNSRSWEYVGIISLAGAGFGLLRYVSGSTRTSTLAHVAYNSTLFLAYFANEGRKSSI